jgi:hypothetical protein
MDMNMVTDTDMVIDLDMRAYRHGHGQGYGCGNRLSRDNCRCLILTLSMDNSSILIINVFVDKSQLSTLVFLPENPIDNYRYKLIYFVSTELSALLTLRIVINEQPSAIIIKDAVNR